MSFHPPANEDAEELKANLSRVAAGSATSPDPTPRTLLPSVFAHDDEFAPELSGGYGSKQLQGVFLSGEQLSPYPLAKPPCTMTSSGGRTIDGRLSNTDTSDTHVSRSIRDSQAPQKFNPLFIVIEDPSTGEQHHPYVHYVFSDDQDTELMTNAILHNLNAQLPIGDDRRDDEAENPTVQGALTNNERVLIVDLDDDGRNIVSARSLSSDWQIVSTRVSIAPTAPTAPAISNDVKPDDNSLMLRISGIENKPPRKLSPEELFDQARSRAQQDQLRALNDLAEQFQQELGVVQRILDTTRTSSSEQNRPAT